MLAVSCRSATRKSMLVAVPDTEHGETRYELLETLRQYARECLTETDAEP